MDELPLPRPAALLPDKVTLLKAKQDQLIKRLFKSFLFLLEEITADHDEAMNRLQEALPEQYKSYVDLADYLSDGRVEANRKKVLSTGNDTLRELHELVDNLRLLESPPLDPDKLSASLRASIQEEINQAQRRGGILGKE
jgi:hypothetical protein